MEPFMLLAFVKPLMPFIQIFMMPLVTVGPVGDYTYPCIPIPVRGQIDIEFYRLCYLARHYSDHGRENETNQKQCL